MVCKGFRNCFTENVKVKDCNDCLYITDASKPTVKEGNVVYTIRNDNKMNVHIFAIDGKLIVGDELRCDYLLLVKQGGKAFYIELKGSDWKHALDQLDNTVRLLQPEIKEYTPHLRVVVKRGAPYTKYLPLLRMRKRLALQYNESTVQVKSRFNDEV